MENRFEFYETPHAFTRWLFRAMVQRGTRISGSVLEPCVGSGAIIAAASGIDDEPGASWHRSWVTNDLDPRWPADSHRDACEQMALWHGGSCDWVVSNPPFSQAIPIIQSSLRVARVGVAMHLRASIHEVLKTGTRRTWMREHPPTGILWLPRFAYQRSRTTGKWTTDSVCACWVVWLKPPRAVHQFIDYAPGSVINELDAETAAYRTRMDVLMANLSSTARASA